MGGGYFYKIKNILLTDIKKFNIYLLLIVILIIIGSVGYTSYSLFSYEVSSPSIYVSFKDTEKPVCVIGEPAVSLMEKSSTTTFEMNCTDNYTVADKELTTSNFTKTGDITVTSVTKEKVGKAMKYVITVTSGTTGGAASIKLNANAVKDVTGNGNVVTKTSEVFVKVPCDAMSEDVSGANSPEVSLASNMIPVCYNSAANIWVKADSTNTSTDYPWYSYSGKTWANAVTVSEVNGTRDDLVDADVGTPIPMNRINTMMVWIPRFSATSNGSYNGGTRDAPRAFNISFVDKSTTAHDAFDFGGAVSGFWIGKFENSSNVTCTPADNSAVGSGCNLNTIRPKILPNQASWRGAMVSTFFYNILNMTENGNQYGFDKTVDITLDTHMLKNNEWGAVAYLTQSIYGKCASLTSCSKIGTNNNSSYITGYGAPAGMGVDNRNGTYNTTNGMKASTTGNIYGVYDMSGGALEYVMGMYWDGIDVTKVAYNTEVVSNPKTNGSGFNLNHCLNSSCSVTGIYIDGVEFPTDSKYYNLYTNGGTAVNPITDYEETKQHALTETKNWYGGMANFVTASNPWVWRGSDIDSDGLFGFGSTIGGGKLYFGSRVSVVINY